ncbi:MAG: DUF512 domain-containing protein [bacterium]
MGLKIISVDPNSLLADDVKEGYSVESVNDKPVSDGLDFQFKTSDEKVKIIFKDENETLFVIKFNDFEAMDLGLTFDEGKIKTCKCNCVFCFVAQQPKGMRRSLYIKDEDYLLSFTHGNFVTFSNTTDEEIERIIEQRMSPIYVSVHATDEELRQNLIRSRRPRLIMPLLKHLGDNGIEMHTQVVLVPGLNDGPYMEKSINDLVALHPRVRTLAVVPVGLTKYREKLTKLRNYTKEESIEIVDYIEKRQKEFLKEKGTRFVWPADEFYVMADSEFPGQSEYEEMDQIENGIGLARELITQFNRKKRHLNNISSNKRVLFMTGQSSVKLLNDNIAIFVRNELNLKLDIEMVANRFWGESVTVSGLLTGRDMLNVIHKNIDSYDKFVIPPDCLNSDALFLDNMSYNDFCEQAKKEVIIGDYDVAQTIREVFV